MQRVPLSKETQPPWSTLGTPIIRDHQVPFRVTIDLEPTEEASAPRRPD